MFGFTRGDSDEMVAGQRDNRKQATARWPFLTPLDLSTLKTEGQLSEMVKVRSSQTRAQAEADVRAWLGDRRF